jgi:hypothetical protein
MFPFPQELGRKAPSVVMLVEELPERLRERNRNYRLRISTLRGQKGLRLEVDIPLITKLLSSRPSERRYWMLSQQVESRLGSRGKLKLTAILWRLYM